MKKWRGGGWWWWKTCCIKYEGGLSSLSRLAFLTYASFKILGIGLCKSDGDCIGVLSKSPSEHPGRFIFSLEGYSWFI